MNFQGPRRLDFGYLLRAFKNLFFLAFGLVLSNCAQAAEEVTPLEIFFEIKGDELQGVLRAEGKRQAWAEGAYSLSFRFADGTSVDHLEKLKVKRRGNGMVVTGEVRQRGLQFRQEWRISKEKGYIEEQITLENQGKAALELTDFALNFERRLDASVDAWRLVAVPFRRQADGKLHDYSMADLRTRRFSNSDFHNDAAVRNEPLSDAGKLRSEAWVLTDGTEGLLIAKYNEEAIEYSVAQVRGTGPESRLGFGGASLSLFREPRGATRIAAGGHFTFGTTRYVPFKGGWPIGYELYRAFLNEHGHGLSKTYNPPLNWNELFDVGWYHSDRQQLASHYTRAALLDEASKAKEVGCDLLYLDPGWEVCEGTTLWDEARLGTPRELSRELKRRFGLDLGYRTIGRVYRDEFPNTWYLRRNSSEPVYRPPIIPDGSEPRPVPLKTEDGRRNLALLPEAKASASSLLPGYPKRHTIDHVNDGYYNNAASWVSEGEPSWVQIDLGADYLINEIVLGSEHDPFHLDRQPEQLEFWTGQTANSMQRIMAFDGPAFSKTRNFQFAEHRARFVRVVINRAAKGNVRLDEVEVYEAKPQPGAVTEPVRRIRPEPDGPRLNFWEVCTQSKDWQREKLKRIKAITSQGVKFMMFDEFDWRGPCVDPQHGHPIPTTPEGHVRAVYGLIERLRESQPEVLVEAHDPVWPWGCRYLPVYFRQSLAGNSYQENWGFEFMWSPIEDLKSGRALCLYYYNLGCDIPLYDHITMESDNDACLSFWWYASTVRHLGIGGKKGLNSPVENTKRFAAYRAAVAKYNRLRPLFARGKFVGLDETAHLHLHPESADAVLNLFNLTDKPLVRNVQLSRNQLGWRDWKKVSTLGADSRVEGDSLVLTIQLDPLSPAVVEIQKHAP